MNLDKATLRTWWLRLKPTRRELVFFLILYALLYALLLWAMNTEPEHHEVILRDDGTALSVHQEVNDGWQ